MTGEKRNSYRCSTDQQGQRAFLRTRFREVAVEVKDVSSGGMCVIVKKRLAPPIGRVVQLRTAGGTCQAEVVTRRVQGSSARLGLRRICDLPDQADLALPSGAGRSAACAAQASRRAGARGLVLAAILCGVVSFWFFLLNRSWLQ